MGPGGIIIVATIATAIVWGWCRVGSPDRDLTDDQIIARGDQRLADLIQGEVR